MDNKEIQDMRFKCLEFVANKTNGIYADSPFLLIVEAEIIYHYVTESKFHQKNKYNLDLYAEDIINKVLDVLIEERKESCKTSQSCEKDSNKFEIPKSFVGKLLTKLRGKTSLF